MGLDTLSDTLSDNGSESSDDSNFDKPPRLVHAVIDFTTYTEFKINPIKDIELPESVLDGSTDRHEKWVYTWAIGEDWTMREGRVLYALREYGDFFNVMSEYHLPGERIGMVEWETLFDKLQNSGYQKNIIPCMVRVIIVSSLNR